MTTGDRREPVVLRWRSDGAMTEDGEPASPDRQSATWGALVQPWAVGAPLGELRVIERAGGAVVRIAAGGQVRPGMTGIDSLTCELRGVVRRVDSITDADGRRRWYDLELAG